MRKANHSGEKKVILFAGMLFKEQNRGAEKAQEGSGKAEGGIEEY